MTIYALLREDGDLPFYVGASSNLPLRLKKHSHRFGFRPWLTVLSENPLDWAQSERDYIAYFKALGADLANVSSGGKSGGRLGSTPSLVARRNMSLAAKRRKVRPFHTDESRAKLSEAIRRKWSEPGQREFQSARMKGSRGKTS